MRLSFEGKTALVTGGTRGIGRQIASDLAALGAKVIITGTKPAEAVTAEMLSEIGHQISYHQGDLSSPASTKQLLQDLTCYPRIDILINNAGINRINELPNTKEEDWDDILTVNLKAPFLLLRALAPAMQARGYGRVINIASVFGLVSREKRSIYSASKFGLRGLTVSLSNELSRDNVLINTVSPGFVGTELTRSILKPEEITALEQQIPMRRLAEPQDISRAVVFLASDLNTYITGQNLVVDGGFTNV